MQFVFGWLACSIAAPALPLRLQMKRTIYEFCLIVIDIASNHWPVECAHKRDIGSMSA